MSTLGRTIRVFLAEGTAEGLRTAEIINWTGKLFVFARARLADFAQREEATRTGIYFLVGRDLDDPLKDAVYIGESDNISKRLAQHDGDVKKDFWTQTVVVISKDENLTKAHVRYLESRIIQLAHSAGRACIFNGTSPVPPRIPESDTADMETFLAQVQILLPVLGFSFIKPLPTIPKAAAPGAAPVPSSSSPVFILSFEGNTLAEAQEIDSSFIVREGSKARTKVGALSKSYIQKREQLRGDNTLQDSGHADFWMFTKDVAFDSPSAAAAVVNGYSSNGRQMWKRQNTGETYQHWKESQMKQTSPAIVADASDESGESEATDDG